MFVDNWYSLLLCVLTDKRNFWWSFFHPPYMQGTQEEWGPYWKALATVGAALSGIRVHGDFEGAAERSAEMRERLQEIDKLLVVEDMTFAKLAALTDYAAAAMAGEIGDWNFVYRGRPLALPA